MKAVLPEMQTYLETETDKTENLQRFIDKVKFIVVTGSSGESADDYRPAVQPVTGGPTIVEDPTVFDDPTAQTVVFEGDTAHTSLDDMLVPVNRIKKKGNSDEVGLDVEAGSEEEKANSKDLVHVSDKLLGYIHEIIRNTREESRFVMGASPRATISLVAASRARAYLEGRDFVKPDDVKAVAVNVLHHRMTLTSASKIGREDTDSILRSLILKAKIPME